jgi:hypothetical protein
LATAHRSKKRLVKGCQIDNAIKFLTAPGRDSNENIYHSIATGEANI